MSKFHIFLLFWIAAHCLLATLGYLFQRKFRHAAVAAGFFVLILFFML